MFLFFFYKFHEFVSKITNLSLFRFSDLELWTISQFTVGSGSLDFPMSYFAVNSWNHIAISGYPGFIQVTLYRTLCASTTNTTLSSLAFNNIYLGKKRTEHIF